MVYVLSVSVFVLAVALAWAFHLVRRVRDYRLWFLFAVVAVVAVGQVFELLTIVNLSRAGGPGPAGILDRWMDELNHLVTSIFLLLSVMFVGRMVGARDRVVTDLRSSEERYRRLLEQCADAVFVHSAGKFVFVNNAGAGLLGAATPDALIGRPILDIVHPDFRAHVTARIEQLSRQPRLEPMEQKLLRLDGKVIDVEVSGTACEFRGAPAVQVIARDISMRKRAQEELLESRTVLERAQSVAHVGSWVWTPGATPELEWSSETFRIFGLDPASFDGRLETFLRCVHPDDLALVHAASESARAEGRVYSVDHRIIRPDGQVRWVHEEADYSPAQHDQHPRMIGVVQDITDRRLAQVALEESERRYRQLFRLSPQPMWVYDHQTRLVLAVNEAAVRHYGYPREDFLRMTVDDLCPPGAPPASGRTDALESGGLLRHRRRDGSIIDVEVIGQSVGFIGQSARLVLARDVTEQRRADQLLAGQGRVLELLARGSPLDFVLSQLARTFEGQIDGACCSVHLLDAEKRRLFVAAGPSLSPEYLAGINGGEIGPDRGSCGAAAYRRERIVVHDIAEHPLCSGCRHLFLPHGVQAIWSQPIIGVGGAVHGTLAMHFRSHRRPSERETEVLEAAASLAGIAVERRRSEEALQEANDRLRAIIWSSPLPIFAIDTEGRARLWNKAAERTFGWTEAEVLDQFNPIVPAHKQAEFETLLRKVLGGESIYGLELDRQRRDGSSIVVSLSAAPLYSPRGEATGVMAVLADITERKRTEAALRESEERLVFAQECAEAGTWDWDVKSGEFRWSDAYCRLYGLEPDVPPSYGAWLQRVHPDDREQAGSELRTAMAERRSDFRIEFRTIHPDRNVRWLGSVGRILYDDTGDAVRMAGICIDITDRKRAEGAALEWRNRYEAAVRASRQLLYDWDPLTNRIVWGGSAEEILGFGLEELGDMDHWLGLVHPDDRQALRRGIDQVISCRRPFSLEHRVRRRDGQYIDVADTGSFFPDPAGAGGRIVGFVSDITQRKRLENELRQTQKLDAIGRLASGVAHDFNNLLTAIFGYTSLARRTLSPNHPATRALDRVDEAARQATGVTRGLLTFSRESPSEKRPLNLARAIDEAVRLLRRTLPANIDLVAELDGNGPLWVRGDPTQLQQVVMNLAINARDAMPAGGRLRIELSQDSSGDAAGARLLVSDTGTGIPPEILPRVFEPFFTTKPPGEGTGLGLSIIHGIVADHGGRIEVLSEPSQGTTFRVLLPCTDPARHEIDGTPVMAAPGQGELILLGDDHTYVREIMYTMLQTMGYRVMQAADGGSVLGMYRENRGTTRLLILDEDMPGCSGWGCIDAIREAGDAVPAVVMVGTGRDGQQELPARTRILRKPFQMHELAAAVAEALCGAGTENR